MENELSKIMDSQVHSKRKAVPTGEGVTAKPGGKGTPNSGEASMTEGYNSIHRKNRTLIQLYNLPS